MPLPMSGIMDVALIDSMSNPEEKPGVPGWTSMLWFSALLIACYAPILQRLINQWNTDDDMGHGFFVPVLAVWIAWQKREEVLAVVPKPNWLGLALVVFGAIQCYAATLGAELFLARTAFVISLIGSILFLFGTDVVRILKFPLFLLFFMVPIPAIIYNQITFPLQLLASRVATSAMTNLLDIPVLRDGNVLELANQKLSVVEACSGIRSLLSLSFLSLIYGYFFEKKIWLRVTLFIATVPIAIVANATRVTITGMLANIDPAYAEGLIHSASGWVIFMIALVILVGFHQAVERSHRMIYATN